MKKVKKKVKRKKISLSLVGNINNRYFNYLKSKAKGRNLKFTVTKKYLWDLFVSQKAKCFFTGLPIHIESKLSRGKKGRLDLDFKNNTASLDRIDNSKGYIKGNCQWTNKKINMMRGRMSVSDYIHYCHMVSQYQTFIYYRDRK